MPKPLLFITGGTGFIGSEVIPATLNAGYRVRLSIRKAEQEVVVRGRFSQFTSDIETVVIPNLRNVDDISRSLEGVEHIIHIASPMPGTGVDLRTDYVNPCVEGTLAVLKAALPFKQIKKVIVMSSALSLLPVMAITEPGADIKENTGEVFPVDLDMEIPEGPVGGAVMYSAAKILAHQATRDFLKNENPPYKVVTFHPGFVLGESVLQQSAEDITGINLYLWHSLLSEKPVLGSMWVHVRDVADAHVRVLETDVDSGTEVLLSHPPIDWEEVAVYAKEKYPELGCKLQPPFQGHWTVDTSTAERVLGMKWRSHHTILDDVIKQQLAFKENKA